MAGRRPPRRRPRGAAPLALTCPRDVAYGLRWPALSGSSGLLADPGHWPAVALSVISDHPPPAQDRVDERQLRWAIQGGRRTIAVDRASASATIHGPAIAADDLIHPYLGPIATVFGRWLGRESFHAGAVDSPAGAWMIVGASETGKSTLLSQLHAAGSAVLCDDVTVVDAGDLLTGPRTLDLREPPHGLEARLVRDNARWRVTLPPAPLRRPLAGWVELRWGAKRTIQELSATERLRCLARWRQWKTLASNPDAFLELATLPGYVLERPRHHADVLADLDRLMR